MRAGARIATVVTAAAMTAVVGGGWGSALSAPAYAPTTGVLAATSPSAGTERVAADVVRVGTEVIPGGVPVPRGTSPVGAPHAFVDSSLRGWETVLDLGDVPAATALELLRTDLAAQGFDVLVGARDVFGARRRAGRWEIVVARVETHGRVDGSREVLTVGVGSRSA